MIKTQGSDFPLFIMPPVTALERVALGPDYWRGKCGACGSMTYTRTPTTEEWMHGVQCETCGEAIDSFERIK